MEEYAKLKKRKGFKYEWNNFSLFCWYLLEKGIEGMSAEERADLKSEVRAAHLSVGRVQIIMNNAKTMQAIQDQVQRLSGKVSRHGQKDRRLSLTCAQRADDYFSTGVYDKALRLYSKALLFYAPDLHCKVDTTPGWVCQATSQHSPIDAGVSANDSAYGETPLSDHEESPCTSDENPTEQHKSSDANVLNDVQTHEQDSNLGSHVTYDYLIWQRARTLEKLNRPVEAMRDLNELFKRNSEYKNKASITFDSATLRADVEPLTFRVKQESDSLEGASAALRMEHSEVKGRLIYSRRPINDGELLFAERPFAHWLRPTCYSTYCHHCMRKLSPYQFFPCNRCVRVRYCSTRCAQQADQEYHHTECALIPVLCHWASGHMSLRLLLRDGLEQVFREEQQPVPESHQWPALGFHAKYSCIRSLIGEQSFTDADYYCPLVIGSVLLSSLLTTVNVIAAERQQQFSTLLLRSLMQILENTFMIYDNNFTPVLEANDTLRSTQLFQQIEQTEAASQQRNHTDNDGSAELQSNVLRICPQANKIGVGLYSAASLVSHSCDNNALKYYNGNQIVIVAGKNVPADSEVNIEYGAHYKMNSLADRRQYLLTNFGFQCGCSACKQGLENIGWSYRCPICSEGALVRNADGSSYCANGNCPTDASQCDTNGSDSNAASTAAIAKQNALQQCDRVAEMADLCYNNAMQSYKKGHLKNTEQQLLRCEQMQAQLYYSDIKLHTVRAQLSALYASTNEHLKAYEKLYSTLPMNQEFHGPHSFESFICLVDMCCLLVLHLRKMAEAGRLAKDASGRLQVVSASKASKSNKSGRLADHDGSNENGGPSKAGKDKTLRQKVKNWLTVFRMTAARLGSNARSTQQLEYVLHQLTEQFGLLKQMLNYIWKKPIKIVNEESIDFLNKLVYLDSVMLPNGSVNVPALLEATL